MITILLVRHADVDVPPPIGNPDPSLSSAGLLRAEELARVAEDAGVVAVFTSELRRTKQTAEPLATRLGLVQPLPVLAWSEEFAADLRAGAHGRVVLIVGHSNTVPKVIESLTHVPADSIPIASSQFDNLFVVTLTASESQLVHLKYGAATQ